MPEARQERNRELSKMATLSRDVPLILLMVAVVSLFTGGFAYGVESRGGGAEVDQGVMVNGVREFRIDASQWDFDPAKIRVRPGEKVRFVVTSVDITHGLAINELGINLPLPPGEKVVKEVVIPPDVPGGTYTMYCSIFCGIGHPYMKGETIIGEPGLGISRLLPYIATALMALIFVAFIIMERRRAR